MGTYPKVVVRSLSARLLLSLFLTVGIVLAVYAFVSVRSTAERFTEFVRADAQRCSSLIRKATHDGMLLNRKPEVQTVLERIAQGSTVTAVRIYDPEGGIALSSAALEIGRRVPVTGAPCSTCHRPGEAAPVAAFVDDGPRARGAGENVLRHLSVIENEPDCAAVGCHASPAARPVLGLLEVEMSTRPLEDTLRASRRQTIWTMASLILLTGVLSSGFVHRVVHRPVLQLHEGTERIARGELDTRIEVAGRHELAELAQAFNRMAQDLKAAREEATGWSRRLEEKVVEKTEELQRSQRQVLHMEKMASLGKLSATVAHELNNPLSGILTYARLVERELAGQPLDAAVGDELREYLRLVQQECSRCGTIVQNLLLFARRSGSGERAPVDLNAVVERSLMITRHHLEISGIHLGFVPFPGDSTVVGDAGQLQQALVALVVNAVEAMSGPGGQGGELTLRLEGDEEEMRIDVGDTGVGIHPDVLPHIFEPFFSTKERESGVGLGLAVVYGIVQRHDGSIEVQSEPGRGSTFHVRLPRRPAPDAGEAAAG